MPRQPGVSCGTCPAAQPTAQPGTVECHGDVPDVFITNPPTTIAGLAGGPSHVMVQPVFPPMKASVGWCARHPKFRWDVESVHPALAETEPVAGAA